MTGFGPHLHHCTGPSFCLNIWFKDTAFTALCLAPYVGYTFAHLHYLYINYEVTGLTELPVIFSITRSLSLVRVTN